MPSIAAASDALSANLGGLTPTRLEVEVVAGASLMITLITCRLLERLFNLRDSVADDATRCAHARDSPFPRPTAHRFYRDAKMIGDLFGGA